MLFSYLNEIKVVLPESLPNLRKSLGSSFSLVRAPYNQDLPSTMIPISRSSMTNRNLFNYPNTTRNKPLSQCFKTEENERSKSPKDKMGITLVQNSGRSIC